MKNILLSLMVFGIVGCTTTPPPDSSTDFRAHAAAPEFDKANK